MATTHENMSPDELDKAMLDLYREEQAIRAKRLEMKEVYNRKVAEEQAQRLLAGLTPGQIDAVAHAASASLKVTPKDAG